MKNSKNVLKERAFNHQNRPKTRVNYNRSPQKAKWLRFSEGIFDLLCNEHLPIDDYEPDINWVTVFIVVSFDGRILSKLDKQNSPHVYTIYNQK